VNTRAEGIQKTLNELKNAISSLDKTISSDDTKDFLLYSAQTSLHDVEHFLLPQGLKAASPNAAMWLDVADFQLRFVYKTLLHTQDLITKYGPNLRVTNG
jgi:hypothetical protein